jgi:hypothetical protein
MVQEREYRQGRAGRRRGPGGRVQTWRGIRERAVEQSRSGTGSYMPRVSPTAPRFRGRMSADTRARTRQRHRLQVAAEQTPVGLEQAAVMHAQVMVKGSTSGKSGQRHTRLRLNCGRRPSQRAQDCQS